MIDKFLYELKLRGFTQDDIAKIAGVKRSHISNLSKGCRPSIDVVLNLANYFNVTADHVLGRGENGHKINTATTKSMEARP